MKKRKNVGGQRLEIKSGVESYKSKKPKKNSKQSDGVDALAYVVTVEEIRDMSEGLGRRKAYQGDDQ